MIFMTVGHNPHNFLIQDIFQHSGRLLVITFIASYMHLLFFQRR